jgi:hypothetical protein
LHLQSEILHCFLQTVRLPHGFADEHTPPGK